MSSDSYRFCEEEPTRAEILLQLGILYWRRGNLDRSEQLLTKASQVSEENENIRFLAQCFIGLALVKTSLDKGDAAIAAYERAIPLDPENFHLWNNLGNLYLQNSGLEQALEAFKKALNINTDDIIAWTGLANCYYQNGSVDEAINAYKRAIGLMPKTDLKHLKIGLRTPDASKHFVLPWIRLAELYSKKCQYQKAIESYHQVLTIDVENAEAWNEIGALYIKMEIYEESIKAFSKSVEINPASGQAQFNLAFAYKKIGKHQESIPHYLDSIGLLKKQQDKELALDLMEDAISSVQKQRTAKTNKRTDTLSTNSSFHDDVTWFYYKYNEEITSINLSCSAYNREKLTKQMVSKLANKGKLETIDISNKQQAEKGESDMPYILPVSPTKDNKAVEKGISVQKQDFENEITDPNVWNEKGNFHFTNKAFEDAIMAYTRAIEIDSTFGQPYNNLALICFIQGDYDEAIQLYNEGIQLLTTDREKAIALNGLGNVYRRVKDYESARVAYQNAAKLDETNGGVNDCTSPFKVSEKNKTADFWNDLGNLFFKAGIYDKAISAFQKSIRLEPDSGHSYGYLARALTAQGQYKDAVSLYQKSIDLIPSNKDKADVWNRLGDVHRKLNDYDNALKAYQNATVLTNDTISLLSRTRLSLLSNCAAK